MEFLRSEQQKQDPTPVRSKTLADHAVTVTPVKTARYHLPKDAVNVGVMEEEDWVEGRCFILSHVAVASHDLRAMEG